MLVTYTGREGEVPWILGPIVKPVAQKGDQVTLSVRGVGALLDRRVVPDRDYVHEGTEPSAAVMEALAASRVRLQGRSLGTIAQDVVGYATNKAGGQLPIRFGSPRETGARLNERTYEGWNLANNGAWKRLTELSNVINGPDFMFRPAWADEDRTRVEWVMVHGTAAQPVIHQEHRMVLDATARRAAITGVDVTTDAGELTNRVYWTGAGEGQGTLIRSAQSIDALAAGMPLLESVGSTSDTENPELVQAHARAALEAGAAPRVQYSGTINLADQRTAAGLWHVGDEAVLNLSDRVDVPDGERTVRIIAAKGSLGSDLVTLELEHEGGPDGAAA